MNPADVFARKVFDHFQHLHQTVFSGDPAANDALEVEITRASLAYDTPVLILVAPWTLSGMAQPPDGHLVSDLRIGHSHYPALENDVAGIGRYWSVLLEPNVSGYRSQDEARSVADEFFEAFKSAIEKTRLESTEVEDLSRRTLLTGRPPVSTKRSTPFGTPGYEGDG